MVSNVAGLIRKPGDLVAIEAVDQWVPAEGELLVRVEAVNFNPIDAKLQRSDLFQSKYPLVVGFTFAGTVISTGRGVESVQSGDRVVVARWGRTGADHRFGALQRYALALEQNTLRLEPESTTLEAATGLIANLATVVSALSIHMGLAKPPLNSSGGLLRPSNPNEDARRKRVLVYGGSSAVGGLAVQYAAAAGYEVVTTASPANRPLVEARAAATHIIDHHQSRESLLDEIRTHGPYDGGIFEAIGSQTTTQLMADLLRDTGGQFFSTSPSPGDDRLPTNVTKIWSGYSEDLVSNPENRESRAWFMERFLPRVLKDGTIWPNPGLWLPGGLRSAQRALDLLHEGRISGKKILINPQE
ncbi:zinc-binding alcohol dehydrogenase family protein [Aspergillus fijiensis CBS 313.89]|uniref:Alcohol dehydrogenase n=1 Tax=Aspergillus fijiensis CBS 313.89 TaxID=1448319 RepID=A0A8G1VW03_9EURO|nr:alcohol dehydrogenase [Aspergillus fijiensis CBS 313.89]RAK71479.1 alcohol dehydrogenase [Aspergillus fijiensis CBS 313.89]